MLINLIEYTYKNKQYDSTEVLLTQLDLISKDYTDFFHRAVLKFFEGLLVMKRKDEQKGRQMAEGMIKIMNDLDQQPLARMFSLLIEE